MTSAALLPHPGQSAPATFTAAAIHDGTLAGFRVKEALRRLDHLLASEFQVRAMAWSFQQLERLDMRCQALRGASGAQMIIIAGLGAMPLPPHIERWLNACLSEHRVRPAVLVALPDTGSPSLFAGETMFLHAVRQFAARWQLQVMTTADFDHDVSPEFVRRRFLPASMPPVPRSGRHAVVEFEAVPRFYGING